jgi:hypothetical protein
MTALFSALFGRMAVPGEMPIDLPFFIGSQRIMQRTFCLLLFCVTVFGGAALAQAQQTAFGINGQPVSDMNPTVVPAAYVQNMDAGKLESTFQNGQTDADVRFNLHSGETDGSFSQYSCGESGIIGGYDFLFLKPHSSYGYAYESFHNDGPRGDYEMHDFSTRYAFTPRFWLGYQGHEGLGARVRYMQFNQEIAAEGVTAPADTTFYSYAKLSATAGQELVFHYYLKMHVLDAEFTQDFAWRSAKLTTGAGLRYGEVAFSGNAYVTDSGTIQETAVYGESFDGVGPTIFLDVKTPIRQSALSFVGGLRGSVLFGRSNSATEWDNPLFTESAINHSTGTRAMGMVDGIVGLQYDHCLLNHMNGFLRFTWEGQLWINAFSSGFNGDLAMEGICLAVGVSR